MERGGAAHPPLPQRGAFAASEVLPLIRSASAVLESRRIAWRELRDAAAEAKSAAKKIRADYLVSLRVWGTLETGSVEIRTAVERNEWADANPDIQNAELAADLAQSASMDARAALDHAEEHYKQLSGLLAIERDDLKRQYNTPDDRPF